MSDDGDTLQLAHDRLNEATRWSSSACATAPFAADISAHENPEIEGARAQFIDPWMVGPNLDPFLAGVGAYARHLLAWHRSSRFCGRCGSPTEAARPGSNAAAPTSTAARCTSPASIRRRSCWCRTPAGSAASWPAITTSRRRSTRSSRAMSTRETLEQTVVREVAEEVGLRIGQVRYAAYSPGPSATL